MAALSAIAGSATGAALGKLGSRAKIIKVPYLLSGKKAKVTKRFKKKTTFRKKRFSKRGRKRRGGISKRVSTLEKKMKTGKGTLTYHRIASSQMVCGLKFGNIAQTQGSDDATNLDTIISNLRYYNVDTNTFTTPNPSTLTASQEFAFKVKSTLLIKNGGTVPVQVWAWALKVKKNTDTGPLTAFTAGMADQGNPATTGETIFPTMSRQFNEYYKITGSKYRILKAGEYMSLTLNTKWFNYDPSSVDTENPTYNTNLDFRMFLIKMHGVLGQSNYPLAEVTPIEACINYETKRETVCYYNAGSQVRDFLVNDGRPSVFTNGVGCTGCTDIPDNVIFSRQ